MLDAYTRPDFDAAALVTVDVQADLLDGSPHCIPGTSAIVPMVARLADAWRAARRPVFHLVRMYDPSSTDIDRCRRAAVGGGHGMLQPKSAGVELAPGVLAEAVALDTNLLRSGEPQWVGSTEAILYKPRWGGFYRTPLSEYLVAKGVTTVVVAGCNFPNCPRTTVYEASERDFRVVLVRDAVSGFSAQGGRELEDIGVALMTTDEVAAELARSMSTPTV